MALGQPVDRHDVACIDSHLGASLGRLRAAHAAHAGAGPMLVDGVPLDDLCLTFVLPGTPSHLRGPCVTRSELRQSVGRTRQLQRLPPHQQLAQRAVAAPQDPNMFSLISVACSASCWLSGHLASAGVGKGAGRGHA